VTFLREFRFPLFIKAGVFVVNVVEQNQSLVLVVLVKLGEVSDGSIVFDRVQDVLDLREDIGSL